MEGAKPRWISFEEGLKKAAESDKPLTFSEYRGFLLINDERPRRVSPHLGSKFIPRTGRAHA